MGSPRRALVSGRERGWILCACREIFRILRAKRPPCQFRSGWVPLFRTSGDQLTGCGVSHLFTPRGVVVSPGWRDVAWGGPGEEAGAMEPRRLDAEPLRCL